MITPEIVPKRANSMVTGRDEAVRVKTDTPVEYAKPRSPLKNDVIQEKYWSINGLSMP
jgi:hypothetical protein